MAKTSAKANRVNQDEGDRNRGSEPGQEQLHPRLDRQNTGNAGGSDRKAKNQGRRQGPKQALGNGREEGSGRRGGRRGGPR